MFDLKLRLYFFENGPNPSDVGLVDLPPGFNLAVLGSHLFPKIIHNNHRLYEMVNKWLMRVAGIFEENGLQVIRTS